MPVEATIRDLATAAPVAGFDETGVRATGSLHWLHTVSTQFLTWYYAHKRRGSVAMDAAGILPEYRGRAVHDFWKSYFNYGCDHALCNAHLLRELTFLWEQQDQQWAKEMTDHLLAIKDVRKSPAPSAVSRRSRTSAASAATSQLPEKTTSARSTPCSASSAAPPSCRRSTPRDHRPTYRTNLSANFSQVAVRFAAAT